VTYTVHSNLSWIFFFIPIVIYLVHSNVIISCHFRQCRNMTLQWNYICITQLNPTLD
jgi:hypothetical protein